MYANTKKILNQVSPPWFTTYKKIAQVKKLIDETGKEIRLEVDGGITVDNIAKIADAGADTFVLGSQPLFASGTYTETFTSISGCDSFVTVDLSIIQSPLLASLTGPDSVFVNDIGNYLVSDVDSLSISVTGGQDLGIPGADTLSILWDSAGIGYIYIEVYDSFGCFVDTLSMSVYILDIPTSVYESENIPKDKKSVAISVALQSTNKTLSEKDLDQISKKIIDVVKEKTGATIRS